MMNHPDLRRPVVGVRPQGEATILVRRRVKAAEGVNASTYELLVPRQYIADSYVTVRKIGTLAERYALPSGFVTDFLRT